ncbi:MAG: hypothetical protein ABJO09_04300 [Hyphomicrobiales bacterium]|uniref:hypothetical protein n=1 Tax=Nisaea sp. TaxID=2024842 RepID=UPI00328C1210
MKTTTKRIACTLLMLSSMAVTAGTSHAKNNPFLKFDVHSNQYSNAVMEFEHSGGKYKWKQKTISLKVTISGDAGRHRKWLPTLDLKPISMTPGTKMVGKIPSKKRKFKYSDTIRFKTSFLKSFAPSYAEYCNRTGGSKTHVKDGLFFKVRASAANSKGKVLKHIEQVPVRVVCKAKPSNPQRTPAKFKATKVKLYTIPAKPVCGKPIKLITEIWTTKPGKVDFFLTRNDGAKQKASVKTQKTANGYVKRWGKTYEFNKSVNRRYQIVLAKQAMTSGWAEIKLNCGAGADVIHPKAMSK